jgi:tripartite-type tricarboxylate transporter receptor subunit TctC
MKSSARGLFVAALALLAIGPGRSAAADDFYAGKTVSVFLGTTPGGGYDTYGRLLARHLGRQIPGNPTVVAKNMPGAGGVLVANYLYNQAPRDGLEIGEPQNGAPFEKIFRTLSPDGGTARFDPTQFGWIGSMLQSVFVVVTRRDAPAKTFEEALQKETVLGATATSTDNYVLAVLSNRVFGTKFKVVSGYDGSAAVDLAIENGEVQGAAGKDWSTITATRPDWIRDKTVNIIMQMGMRPHPDLQNVPSALDVVRSPEDKAVLELIFAKYGMSRPFMAPPGVPPERLQILRKAFDDTMKDPEFLADAKKINAEIRPVAGVEVEGLVKKIMATPEPLAARAREMLTP